MPKVLVALVLAAGLLGACTTKKDTKVVTFTVTSPDLTVRGDVSPQLRWFGFPAATQSFAVTMYDRDAKFWHWGVINLPNTTSALERGVPFLPQPASELKNSAGRNGYTGAAPPSGSGVHHYEITVYALDVASIDASTDAGIPGAVSGHVLGKATIVATVAS